MSRIGNRIKGRRKALGLSAEELAPRIRVSPATLYRYENGDTEKIPERILIPLAHELNTTVDYLLGATDDPVPKHSLTDTEVKIYRSSLKHQIYPYLLECTGLNRSIDDDANVFIWGENVHVSETQELIDEVMNQTISYFKFLLIQMSSGG